MNRDWNTALERKSFKTIEELTLECNSVTSMNSDGRSQLGDQSVDRDLSS